MLVKDINGKWYEIDESLLIGKEISDEKAQDQIAEKRKKVADIISNLDKTDMSIIKDLLIGQDSTTSYFLLNY